jgi:hypothetical protein
VKHSNQTQLSLHSILAVTDLLVHSFSLNTDNEVDDVEAIMLSEALKSTASITELTLIGIPVVSFHSHSIQIMKLVMKESSNCLKHSNQTQLSRTST